MVVEKVEELKAIIDVSQQIGVRPIVGVRIRLLAKSSGKWATSGGENAKFGLSTSEVMEATELLKTCQMEDCLKLMHFHIGSQIPDIQTVKRAVREGARYYAKLRQLGFPLEYLDVGGGLGVDYDGSRSANDSSTNYTLGEYARDVVYNVAMSAPRKKCRTRPSSAKAAAPSSRIIPCSSSTSLASSKKPRPSRSSCPKGTSRPSRWLICSNCARA